MSAMLWQIIDVVLAALLIGLAWSAVASPDPRRGVVLFIALGMLLALVWARLSAPDLALAEAAIGAGLTGALLLAALRDEDVVPERRTGALALIHGVLLVAFGGAYGWTLVHALSSGDPVRMADDIMRQLPHSGVSNPVTAVLLNFRAYDTLLELAVLLAAALGVRAIGSTRPVYQAAGPVLAALVRPLVPLLILAAGYLLWVGAHAPGGAFQAGAVLAAAAVLLRLRGDATGGLPGPVAQRWLLVAGIGAFLAVGLGVMLAGFSFLQYPAAWSGVLILLIESGATLAIAAALATAYVGGPVPTTVRGAAREAA